jgi:hypothetical protein
MRLTVTIRVELREGFEDVIRRESRKDEQPFQLGRDHAEPALLPHLSS